MHLLLPRCSTNLRPAAMRKAPCNACRRLAVSIASAFAALLRHRVVRNVGHDHLRGRDGAEQVRGHRLRSTLADQQKVVSTRGAETGRPPRDERSHDEDAVRRHCGHSARRHLQPVLPHCLIDALTRLHGLLRRGTPSLPFGGEQLGEIRSRRRLVRRFTQLALEDMVPDVLRQGLDEVAAREAPGQPDGSPGGCG